MARVDNFLVTISHSRPLLFRATDDATKVLLETRVDLNVESVDARTLLAVALKCNQIFMARLLIVAGGIDVRINHLRVGKQC